MEPRKVASEIEIEYSPDLLALDLAWGGVCFYVEETIQQRRVERGSSRASVSFCSDSTCTYGSKCQGSETVLVLIFCVCHPIAEVAVTRHRSAKRPVHVRRAEEVTICLNKV